MDATTDTTPARPATETGDGDRRFRNRAVAVGLAAGLTLAGFGVAAAQTAEPGSDAGAGDAGVVEPAPAPAADGERSGMRSRAKHRAFGFGPGIHGEFTTRAPDGGWQVIATQLGEVTGVSSSALTVRSEDGHSRTYAVNDDTLVNAGNDGIADVKSGDRVRVTAVVNDGEATAVDVHDITNISASRGKWAPGPPAREPGGDRNGATGGAA